MNAVVRWLDGPGTVGATQVPELWKFSAYDGYGTLLDDSSQQMLHAQGMEYIKQYWQQHAPLYPGTPGPLTVCGTYTTHYNFKATYCTTDGVNLKLGMVQFPGKPPRTALPAFFSQLPADWFDKTSACKGACGGCDYCAMVLDKVLVRAE